MSFTKQEKRLFIREVAKEIYARCANDFPAGQEQKVSARVISDAFALADELESFERKQDEEEAMKQECFGGCLGFYTKKNDCTKCIVVTQCQENRGTK